MKVKICDGSVVPCGITMESVKFDIGGLTSLDVQKEM